MITTGEGPTRMTSVEGPTRTTMGEGPTDHPSHVHGHPPALSSPPLLFCSRSLTGASASSSAQSAAAASSSEAAAAAASRSTVYELDNNKDEDYDEHSHSSISSSSYGDNSVVLVDTKPHARPVAKTPFPTIPGDVLRVMQDRLNANASKTNVESSSTETLRSILDKVIECRGVLIKMACDVDHAMEIAGDGERVEIAELLRKSVPFSVPKKLSKSKICEMLVIAWAVISGIVANSILGREATHQLEPYLSMMSRVESTSRRAITEAEDVNKNTKSIKLTGRDRNRMMLEDRASKPIHAYSLCAMCGHSLVDEPFCNRENARLNKSIREAWAKDHAQHEEYIKSGRNPLVDKNGKVIAKHKNPTLLPEILVCHCWHNTNESFVGGRRCHLNCYDAKTKTQYKPGTCPVCKCLCHFACSKE
jgi:hypothetical protein